jgi:hypothetical protein
MGLMGALGSAVGGMVLGLWGFGALNAVGALALLIPLGGLWLNRGALAWRGASPVGPVATTK